MEITIAILALVNGLLLGVGGTMFVVEARSRRHALEALLEERTKVADALTAVVDTVNPLVADMTNLRERMGLQEIRASQQQRRM